MKLKLDESGKVVVENDMPVYTHDDGRDIPFDAVAATSRITALNGESMRHREGKEALEAQMRKFEGLDPDAARRALETVGNLDKGDLKTAQQVAEIQEQARRAVEDRVAEEARRSGERISTLETQLKERTGELDGEVLKNGFANSPYLRDKVAWPASAVQDVLGRAFKREGGKLVGYHPDGTKMYSRSRPGDVADFEEALEMAVAAYPHRDSMLKGTGSQGGGGRQGRGAVTDGKTMSRQTFDGLPVEKQGEAVRAGLQIVD